MKCDPQNARRGGRSEGVSHGNGFSAVHFRHPRRRIAHPSFADIEGDSHCCPRIAAAHPPPLPPIRPLGRNYPCGSGFIHSLHFHFLHHSKSCHLHLMSPARTGGCDQVAVNCLTLPLNSVSHCQKNLLENVVPPGERGGVNFPSPKEAPTQPAHPAGSKSACAGYSRIRPGVESSAHQKPPERAPPVGRSQANQQPPTPASKVLGPITTSMHLRTLSEGPGTRTYG